MVVGSDLRADLRVAHPLIARAHLLLRFDQGRWIAVDNNSLNGVFVNGQRVPMVDIQDGQAINIGKPDGPRITFEVGHHRGTVGLLPPTETVPTIAPPSGSPAGAPATPAPAPATRRRPDAQRTTAHPDLRQRRHAGRQPATQIGVSEPRERSTQFPTTSRSGPGLGPRADPSGAAVIGRALDSDIVISDVLASRSHAYLVPSPTGMEIHDAHSINGTFVNGTRILSAPLTEGDVVTIGNVDLVFNGEILLRRAEAATRTGGLEVREVDFEIDSKRLIQKVSIDRQTRHADRPHRRFGSG